MKSINIHSVLQIITAVTAWLILFPCQAQNPVSMKYWNAGIFLTPYRLSPPPIVYQPKYICPKKCGQTLY